MTQPLNRLSAAISDIHSSLSIRHVLEGTLKWAEELLAAEYAVIFLPHESGVTVYFLKHENSKIRLSSQKLPKAQGLEAWISASGKATIVNNVQGKNLFLKTASLPMSDSVYNLMAASLKIKSKTLGVLQVMNQRQHKTFTPKHLRFLEMLAAQSAIALANAQAFTHLQDFLNDQKKQLLATAGQLRGANEKLREADQTKSENISMVAHELRSPITSISGFTRILCNGQLGSLNKEQEESCHIILKNAEHIQRLINDLLDLTKLELGKMDMHFEAVACRELIKEAVYSIQGSEAPEKRRIQTSLLPEDIFVEGDRLRLVQVLINLLSNALKYSPVGSPVFLHYEYDKKQVMFSVEDEGAPLTPEQQTKVFEKFYRINKNPADKIPGSGLGLAICRITLQNHGGAIWAEVGARGGNNFRFRLKRIAGPVLA